MDRLCEGPEDLGMVGTQQPDSSLPGHAQQWVMGCTPAGGVVARGLQCGIQNWILRREQPGQHDLEDGYLGRAA
eukprot:11171717-Lingulodinium_polyedra.AAC.1